MSNIQGRYPKLKTYINKIIMLWESISEASIAVIKQRLYLPWQQFWFQFYSVSCTPHTLLRFIYSIGNYKIYMRCLSLTLIIYIVSYWAPSQYNEVSYGGSSGWASSSNVLTSSYERERRGLQMHHSCLRSAKKHSLCSCACIGMTDIKKCSSFSYASLCLMCADFGCQRYDSISTRNRITSIRIWEHFTVRVRIQSQNLSSIYTHTHIHNTYFQYVWARINSTIFVFHTQITRPLGLLLLLLDAHTWDTSSIKCSLVKASSI